MKVKCELCGKKIKGPQGLAPHMRLAHGKPDVPQLIATRVRAHIASSKLFTLEPMHPRARRELYREVARELETAAHALRRVAR